MSRKSFPLLHREPCGKQAKQRVGDLSQRRASREADCLQFLPPTIIQPSAKPPGIWGQVLTRLSLGGCCRGGPARQRIAGAGIDDRLSLRGFAVSSPVDSPKPFPAPMSGRRRASNLEVRVPASTFPSSTFGERCLLSPPHFPHPHPSSLIVLTASASHTEVLS